MIKNFMETLVDQAMASLQKNDQNFFNCNCEECLDDIRAIALNNIKPNYVTGRAGEIFAKFANKDFQNRADITVEVVKAKQLVSQKPHHHDAVSHRVD